MPDTLPVLKTLVVALQKLPFVEAVWLFGSRARGDAAARSDIDLAVLCPTATIKDWTAVLDIIEEAPTLLPIDCVRLDEAGDTLRENIQKHHQVLYQRGTVQYDVA